jgi:hypothetical protein
MRMFRADETDDGCIPTIHTQAATSLRMAPQTNDRLLLLAIAALALVTLAYSVFIARAILQWVGIVLPLVFLYLAWRFVRAHERIADAVETAGGARASAPSSSRAGEQERS